VKFLGMGTQGDKMKEVFEEVRQGFSFSIDMEIIEEHNQILDHDINGIPVVILDDEILFEGKVPSMKELRNSINKYALVMNYSTDSDQPSKIRSILVPMDISTIAVSALEYAKKLAHALNAEVHVIHACSYYFKSDGSEVPSSIEEMKKKKLKELEASVRKVYGKQVVLPNIICELGFPVDVIAANSKNHGLIIMGSTGDHGLGDRLLGSVSSGVAQHAHCSVILIPDSVEESFPTKIMCACQEGNMYDDLVDDLFDLSLGNNYDEIHLVEVVKKENEDSSKLGYEMLEKTLGNNFNNVHFYIDQVTGNNITQSLEDYADRHGIGMIVMITKHRTSIEALFHQSQTKRMVMDIKRPLLVLHVDK
jgi:nucleotide-binding universal stress UspA family protein